MMGKSHLFTTHRELRRLVWTYSTGQCYWSIPWLTFVLLMTNLKDIPQILHSCSPSSSSLHLATSTYHYKGLKFKPLASLYLSYYHFSINLPPPTSILKSFPSASEDIFQLRKSLIASFILLLPPNLYSLMILPFLHPSSLPPLPTLSSIYWYAGRKEKLYLSN